MKSQRTFKYLNQKDRDLIHTLYGNGHDQKDIADILGVHPSTISRELSRYGRKHGVTAPRELKRVQLLLNGRPRKVVGWRTPYEVFNSLIH